MHWLLLNTQPQLEGLELMACDRQVIQCSGRLHRKLAERP
jgi:hypothetical protein